jgi:hypothetical protein
MEDDAADSLAPMKEFVRANKMESACAAVQSFGGGVQVREEHLPGIAPP